MIGLESLPKEFKLLLYYSFLSSLINIGLSLIGEWRVDIYVAFQIISFIVIKSTLSPFHPRVERYLDNVNIVLLVVLVSVIVFRVLVVVGVIGI